MPDLIVNGGKRLSGELRIQGSKNTALPIIASAILTDEITVIDNCPDISDVREMLEILSGIGCECSFDGGRVIIYPKDIEGVPDAVHCRRIRASSILMGAFLSSVGYFAIPYPGGCNIGKRPLNYHIDGLRAIGAVIEENDGTLLGYRSKSVGGKYVFPYPSVGALENIILAAVKADGVTVLENCAKEPEICDLCDFLVLMGADIRGAGTDRIMINGVRNLHGTSYCIPGDRIAAGTYMTCCAAAGGNINITGIDVHRMKSISAVLRGCGCHVSEHGEKDEIIITCDERCRFSGNITAGPYPEFPTDMQPQIMSVAASMAGSCTIEDKVFENRFTVADELNRMGADIVVKDKKAYIRGVNRLHGENVTAHDLRGGAALVTAAAGAAGVTVIKGCGYILRGYEDIQRDLTILGADVKWHQEEKKEIRQFS